MRTFQLLMPGARVDIAEAGIKGAKVLTATATASGDGWKAQYEIAWWDRGDRKTAWVDLDDVEPASPNETRCPIGFRHPSQESP